MIILLVWLAVFCVTITGWITNAAYAYHHFDAGITLENLVAFAGVIAAPLGVLHGIYLWFV
jgi:hypothetical protein